MKELKQVYGLLEDKISRDIWINKLNYLITGQERYLEYIVNTYPHWRLLEGRLLDDVANACKGRQIIAYGAGDDAGKLLGNPRCRRAVACFCDQKADKQKDGIDGFQVISPEELLKEHADAAIIISSIMYEKEIRVYLEQGGIPGEHIFALRDYIVKGEDRQYFDEEFIKFEDNEIFVDAGSCDLQTTINMRRYCPSLKKAFAYEPDSVNVETCLRRKREEGLSWIEVLPYGTWSGSAKLRFISAAGWNSKLSKDGTAIVPLRSVDETIHERVTFIKMDVEGAELESLKGARDTIRQYKPKLAVCIYHKPEDMYEIPLYIKSLAPEYKFYVRHYSCEKYETVLYAIP